MGSSPWDIPRDEAFPLLTLFSSVCPVVLGKAASQEWGDPRTFLAQLYFSGVTPGKSPYLSGPQCPYVCVGVWGTEKEAESLSSLTGISTGYWGAAAQQGGGPLVRGEWSGLE